MEAKEKQKVFAQTYVPSIGIFEDKPGPIQLASKAKDCNATVSDKAKMSFKHNMQKKYAQSLVSQNASAKPQDMTKNGSPSYKTDLATQEKIVKMALPESNNVLKDARSLDGASPLITHDTKPSARFLSPKPKCPSPKPNAPYKEMRNVTSISACTWTPEASSGNGGNDFEKSRDTGCEHPGETRSRSNSISSDSKDVKEPPGFYRSFQVQPGRSAMKMERNRGQHKLPVGIAVARQRHHATPSKLKGAAKSVTPDAERRHHEHALNQEREVLLRENKELSNFTSRLQTSSSTSGLPMLNVPNPVLPAWDREQALMASSLLQWQAQHSLLNSSLQHPSMWFGGSSPYHIPTQQSSTLPTAPTPTSGYPVLGGGIPGGFVIMPQFLEGGAAGMWSPVALYGNAHPASRALAHSFPGLLSQQLNLQSPELQTWQQQQALLQRGLSVSMHKGESPAASGDKNRLRSPTPSYTRKTDSVDCRSPASYRYSASPKNTHKDVKPQPELRQRSPLCSPPSRSQYYKHKTSPFQEAAFANGLAGSHHVRASPDTAVRHPHRDHESHPPNYLAQSLNRTSDVRPAVSANHQILDLTSSQANLPDSRVALKYENVSTAARTHIPVFASPRVVTSVVETTTAQALKEIVIEKAQSIQSCSQVPPQSEECAAVATDLKMSYEPKYSDKIVNPRHSPNESAGVELLTKAADIHLKHMGVIPPQLRQGNPPQNTRSHSPRLPETITDLSVKTYPMDQTVDITTPTHVTTSSASPVAAEVEDISTIDPDVLDAVRGITLLSHASFNRYRQRHESKENPEKAAELPDHRDHVSEPAHSTCGDYNDEAHSTVSYSSVPDPAIFSDGMSSSELKERDSSCERVRLKRRLNRPISSKLKFSKEEETNSGTGIKLDSMEAMEVDMKMRLADLQRRYKEKQRELAKLQKRNKNETKQHPTGSSASSVSSANSTTVTSTYSFSPLKPDYWPKSGSQKHFTSNGQAKQSSHGEFPCQSATLQYSSDKRRKYAETPEKVESVRPKPKSSLKRASEKHEKKQKEAEKNISTPEKRTISQSPTKHSLSSVTSEENETETVLDLQQMPSGSRKRKADKPKRICIPFGERPTVPLVEPAKKSVSIGNSVLSKNMELDGAKASAEKKRKRKLKQAKKKLKREEGSTSTGEQERSAFSSWVFKSSNKIEKHEKKMLNSSKKPEKEKSKIHKAQKKVTNSANLSNNNNTRKKSSSLNEEKTVRRPSDNDAQPEDGAEVPRMPVFTAERLELREEDLVKGLQVLVPLEDKLLYLCQINPIQPPDIYEVTVEGERHRHRPIVMCLEQILSEAVPDVKPRSREELCEGSRVAAYWSHKMHCLYTGTIAFDDSDCEDEEVGDEELVQVEFDDGDSSMIPLEDIRLLPRSYPIMQPEAPFMMHYINRRRNTSEISAQSKESGKNAQNKNKKADKKDKSDDKPRKRATKATKQKTSLDLSAYDYRSAEESTTPSRKRSFARDGAKPLKPAVSANVTETSSSSVSSADEDSDTVFSDSSDDTYEGDDDSHPSHVGEKRLPPKFSRKQSQPTNELWTWYDKDVQKKVVKGKAKKIYHKSISRGDEVISCGDSAVFLSSGRLYLPYIGRIESMWESWGNNMVVKVRWFYHPEETKGGRLKSHGKHPLYKSSHIDENDVQTISHKCEVVSFKEYNRRMRNGERNIFYCTGIYDPATGQVSQEYSDRRKHQKS